MDAVYDICGTFLYLNFFYSEWHMQMLFTFYLDHFHFLFPFSSLFSFSFFFCCCTFYYFILTNILINVISSIIQLPCVINKQNLAKIWPPIVPVNILIG